LPEHCVVPGTQTPVQAPAAHAAFVHGCAVPHVPVKSQVCTASPEQRVAPGVQTPVQAPDTQA
jgi:hypothetical protein